MAKITWVAPNPGTWTTLGNWSPAQIPGAADSVLFDGSGSDLSFVGTSTVANLTLNDPTTLLTVTGALTVVNDLVVTSGTLAVTGNAKAVLNNFTNQGTITIAATGTVVATGSYSADSVERIGGSGGNLELHGTLDNVGGTFTLPTDVRLVSLGVIHGGTVVGDVPPRTFFRQIQALDGVTWRGGLGLSAGFQDVMEINNGFAIYAPDGVSRGTIDISNIVLQFNGDQLFDNAILRLRAEGMGGNFVRAGGTLTLGAGIDIPMTELHGGEANLSVRLEGIDTNSKIVNNGTIVHLPRDGPTNGEFGYGGGMSVSVHEFINNGIMAAAAKAYDPNVYYNADVYKVSGYITIDSAIFKNGENGTIRISGYGDEKAAQILVSQATDFTNDGTIFANGGSIDIDPFLQGGGIVTVASDGTVDLGVGASQGQTIAFIDSGVLELGTPALFAGTITGVTKVTRIDLAVSAKAIAYTNNHLTMQLGGGQTFNLNIVGDNLTLSNFVVNSGAATTSISTNVPAPCFAAGTRIATDAGDVAVEDLNIGDNVLTAPDAAPQSIVWIGQRLVDCRHHPNPRKVWPVRIAAGAFAPCQPARDLFLSPDHAVFVDDVLIPVKYLINGGSIAQIEMDDVEYYHIELAHHDIIVAEGLPVESYLDTGDRASFANGGAAMDLFPVFGSGVGLEILREACSRAPLVIVGAVVEGVRRRLDRARSSKRRLVSAR